MPDDVPGWPWRPDLCPADLHYTEYLLGNHRTLLGVPNAPTKVIHVGTGLHHHVGLLLGSHGWTVIGLTISKDEFSAWARLERRPPAYICTLRDIRDDAYNSVGDALADSMSVFHLGETPAGPGQRSDREVIEHALTWSREVVFYTGSYGWPHIEPVVAQLVSEGRMTPAGEYKTLVAFRSNA